MASFARKSTFAYFWCIKSKKVCDSSSRKKRHGNLRHGAFFLTDRHYVNQTTFKLAVFFKIALKDG
jgi:hypothetical protein